MTAGMDRIQGLLLGVDMHIVATLFVGLLVARWWNMEKSKLPQQIPWVGRKRTALFPFLRTWFTSYTSTRAWLAEGYERFSKHGKPFVLPDFSGKPIVLVPHAQWKWFVDRSDGATSFEAAIFDLVVGQYNFPDAGLLRHFYCTRVAHRFISKTLPNLAAPTWEELESVVGEVWREAAGNEWIDADLHSSTQEIILRVACRVIVGPELARNKEFLTAVAAHENDVVRVAMLDPFLPKFLRPVLGPYLLALPNWYHFQQIRRLVLPVIRKRLAAFQQSAMEKKVVPKDYVTWHIQTAIADRKTSELEPEWIAKSFLPILFGTVHGTHGTLVNLLLNILSSPPEQNVLGTLREEVQQVSRAFNGIWDKHSLVHLVRTDSAIRESMRLDGLTAHVLYRKVTETGLTYPTEGWTLPKGTTVAVDAWTRHRDPNIYERPNEYDAFRFSREREAFEVGSYLEGGIVEKFSKSGPKLGIVDASDSFLTFGLGRHACPGRSWVDIALKMFVAHMLQEYEFESLSSRPPNAVHGPYSLPNEHAKIRVRRAASTKSKAAVIAGADGIVKVDSCVTMQDA